MDSRTKQDMIESARQYKSRGEWREADMRGYARAWRMGWLEDCTAHMGMGKTNRRGISNDELIAIARKFDNTTQWQAADFSAYNMARRRGILPECRAHMKNHGGELLLIQRLRALKGNEAMSEFTTAEKLAAVEREISLRRRVYPNRIMTHRMTQKLADQQIALMEAIAEDYRRMDRGENLFGFSGLSASATSPPARRG